jgi:AraC family transcriptional regulator, transcriptional activator of pobA
MTQASRLARYRGGLPVYQYRADSETPPVSVIRDDGILEHRVHIHDFPVLWYAHTAGRLYVVAPGAAVDPTQVPHRENGVGVFFDPAALDGDGRSPWPSWRLHPLLFPFVHGQSSGLLQLKVPAARQPVWDSVIDSIETELGARKEGYRQAALAHLTLLLIDVARLAGDVVGDLKRSGEPLLAEVFTVIDRRLSEPLSLSDVADELGMTPGHLTTVVRRRTGAPCRSGSSNVAWPKPVTCCPTPSFRSARSLDGSAYPIRDTSAGCFAAPTVRRRGNGAIAAK